MLGFKPYKFYFYMWKYVSPTCLLVLIAATVIEMAISPPGYNAWVQDQVSETLLQHLCMPEGEPIKIHIVMTIQYKIIFLVVLVELKLMTW